jgi:TrmH family RNA methyltransferase
MAQMIASLQNPIVKHLVKLRQDRDYRYAQQSLLLMGAKPIAELSAHYLPKRVMTVDPKLLPPHCQEGELIIVGEPLMQKVTGMVRSEGIVAEFAMPAMQPLHDISRLLVLDAIGDPGNMGTLFRTALALGWPAIFIVGNSCDPYNEKALRAAKGATFHLPWQQGSWQELEALIFANGLKGYVADIHGAAVDAVGKVDRPLLLLSNEAHGPSPEALRLCQRVSIPMGAMSESLNVATAGAILMYVM